jgi:hypothetical protein
MKALEEREREHSSSHVCVCVEEFLSVTNVPKNSFDDTGGFKIEHMRQAGMKGALLRSVWSRAERSED